MFAQPAPAKITVTAADVQFANHTQPNPAFVARRYDDFTNKLMA